MEIVRQKQMRTTLYLGYHSIVIYVVDGIGIYNFKVGKLAGKLLFEVVVSHDGIVGETEVISVKQLEDISENLGAVASVDFLDNEIYRLRLIILLLAPSGYIGIQKRLIDVLICYLRRCNRFASDTILQRNGLVAHIGINLLLVSNGLIRSDKRCIIRIRMERDTVMLVFLANLLYSVRLAGSGRTEVDKLERFVKERSLFYDIELPLFFLFWRFNVKTNSQMTVIRTLKR